jgi:hypothetical protein
MFLAFSHEVMPLEVGFRALDRLRPRTLNATYPQIAAKSLEILCELRDPRFFSYLFENDFLRHLIAHFTVSIAPNRQLVSHFFSLLLNLIKLGEEFILRLASETNLLHMLGVIHHWYLEEGKMDAFFVESSIAVAIEMLGNCCMARSALCSSDSLLVKCLAKWYRNADIIVKRSVLRFVHACLPFADEKCVWDTMNLFELGDFALEFLLGSEDGVVLVCLDIFEMVWRRGRSDAPFWSDVWKCFQDNELPRIVNELIGSENEEVSYRASFFRDMIAQ